MTIKVANNLSFKRDHHGYILIENYIGVDKDKQPKQQTKETFHPNLDAIAGKILHLCGDDPKIEMELEDLRNAFFSCKAEIAAMLKKIEGKVDDSN
jgi:transcriptional antiterminator